MGKLFKRLINKKGSAGTKDDATPNYAALDKYSGHDVLESKTSSYRSVVESTDATEQKTNATLTKSIEASQTTDADDVLDGILQDLNIKVGQLAVDAGQCTETISEYSGGSPKGVESESSEVKNEEMDDDDDDGGNQEEVKEEEKESTEDEAEHVVAAKKKKIKGSALLGLGIVAAKRGRTPSPAMDSNASSGVATEPGKQGSGSIPSKPEQAPKKSAKSFLPKRKNRGASPLFSPEIDPNAPKVIDDEVETKSCTDTKDTTKDTDESAAENTFEDNTLGTDGSCEEEESKLQNSLLSMSESQNDEESTVDGDEEGEDSSLRKTKKTVMNKDVIIHQPGGPSSLVVRAMYYTPLPASPDDIIIKVEVSCTQACTFFVHILCTTQLILHITVPGLHRLLTRLSPPPWRWPRQDHIPLHPRLRGRGYNL